METNTIHIKTGFEAGGGYINQSKVRTFSHAAQHLSSLHLKTKLDALIGVHREGYKSITEC